MLKIKISFPEPIWPILRQTPGSEGIWENCRFYVNNECEEYDYWVVYENLKSRETAKCPKQNTILITGEPISVKVYDNKFLDQFGKIITFRDDIIHPNIIHSQPCLPWMVGGKYIKETHYWESAFSKDFDELSKITSFHKTKLLSIILSKKFFSEGHRKRDHFISLLKAEFGDDLDIFGIGYNEIKDKWDGIAPYKYYLAIENSSYPDYWTEKLSDCFLAGAYPIYYGCPNILDYFSNDCLSTININDSEKAIQHIKNIISSNSYERFENNIYDARSLLLNEYNLFPKLSYIINDLEKDKEKKINFKITLKPEKEITMGSTIKKIGKKLVKKAISKLYALKSHKKISYSQTGEDLIIRFIFDRLKVKKPSYIDIGAHHPKFINNTALFYRNGSKGINVEPNPHLFKSFTTNRKRDHNLNIGIAANEGLMKFYIMFPPTLSTFSKEEAETLQKESQFRIQAIEEVHVNTLTNVINKYNDGKFPDFLSIDVEGLEYDILEQIDFKNNYPKVICIETLALGTLSVNSTDAFEKDTRLINYILERGYKIYADTSINTIFIKEGLL